MSTQSPVCAYTTRSQTLGHTPTETVVKYYLAAYNVVSTLGWTYILVTLLAHLLIPTAEPTLAQPIAKASSTITRYLPFLKSSPILNKSTPAQIKSILPSFLVPYFLRACTAYGSVGERTAWVQTLAVLEIVHVLLGFVKSAIQTTVMQVFSRLALVWYIAENFEVVSFLLSTLLVFAFLSLYV